MRVRVCVCFKTLISVCARAFFLLIFAHRRRQKRSPRTKRARDFREKKKKKKKKKKSFQREDAEI